MKRWERRRRTHWKDGNRIKCGVNKRHAKPIDEYETTETEYVKVDCKVCIERMSKRDYP